MDPCESLCTYDKRNPYGYLSYGPVDECDEVPPPRQQGCACDNCFYGRDRLAMEVIRLRHELASSIEVAGKAGEERDRFRTALERISIMSCRCIDNGQPCAGCTEAGREAPRLAHKTLNP